MSELLEVAEAQFKEKLAVIKNIEVPDWNIKIYFRQSMTFKQQAEILALTNKDRHVDAIVTTLILRALNEDLEPLFKPMDKVRLKRCDPDIISRIVTEMGGDELDVDEAEKN
jgi:hypothetical protein